MKLLGVFMILQTMWFSVVISLSVATASGSDGGLVSFENASVSEISGAVARFIKRSDVRREFEKGFKSLLARTIIMSAPDRETDWRFDEVQPLWTQLLEAIGNDRVKGMCAVQPIRRADALERYREFEAFVPMGFVDSKGEPEAVIIQFDVQGRGLEVGSPIEVVIQLPKGAFVSDMTVKLLPNQMISLYDAKVSDISREMFNGVATEAERVAFMTEFKAVLVRSIIMSAPLEEGVSDPFGGRALCKELLKEIADDKSLGDCGIHFSNRANAGEVYRDLGAFLPLGFEAPEVKNRAVNVWFRGRAPGGNTGPGIAFEIQLPY